MGRVWARGRCGRACVVCVRCSCVRACAAAWAVCAGVVPRPVRWAGRGRRRAWRGGFARLSAVNDSESVFPLEIRPRASITFARARDQRAKRRKRLHAGGRHRLAALTRCAPFASELRRCVPSSSLALDRNPEPAIQWPCGGASSFCKADPVVERLRLARPSCQHVLRIATRSSPSIPG